MPAQTDQQPQIDILVASEQSGDAVGIVHLTVPPGWDGPPLHRHDFDEAFYILNGELTFQLGPELKSAVPGELVFAQRGSIHTLANLGKLEAQYLLVCTPGEFTRYFEQLSRPIAVETSRRGRSRIPRQSSLVPPSVSIFEPEPEEGWG